MDKRPTSIAEGPDVLDAHREVSAIKKPTVVRDNVKRAVVFPVMTVFSTAMRPILIVEVSSVMGAPMGYPVEQIGIVGPTIAKQITAFHVMMPS